jgi:hypothetical protein
MAGKIIQAIFGKDEKPAKAIRLDHAVLCMNCETVFEVSQRTCPLCCSETYLNIGLALGDEETKARVVRMDPPQPQHLRAGAG